MPGRGAAFDPNSRQKDSVEIFELFSSHPIFQLKLRKLFQSQMLWITRNKYCVKRLPIPAVILQLLAQPSLKFLLEVIFPLWREIFKGVGKGAGFVHCFFGKWGRAGG